MNTNDFIFLLTDLFGTYTIYKFMKIFFTTLQVDKRLEFLSYLLFYAFISVIFLTFNIPIIILICNIIGLFALTHNYIANLKNRLLAVMYMYIILISIELIVVIFTGYFQHSIFKFSDYNSIFGMVSTKILTYIAVCIIEKFKNIKLGVKVPNSYWFSAFLIPISSLYIMILLFQSSDISLYQLLFGTILLLTINFVAFQLYDILNAIFEEKIEKTMLEEQNKYYNQQFLLMQDSLSRAKVFRHDLKNHLSVLETIIKDSDAAVALDYIKQMNRCSSRNYNNTVYSGNVDLDSILNFKFQEAETKDIHVVYDIIIPDNLNVTTYDMVALLGNLLDNSINASMKIEKDRKITVKISYKKGILFIHICNTYNGIVKYIENKIVTTHEDKGNHGYGLKSVEGILEKYHGEIEIRHTDNIFCVDILMYIQ